MTALPVDRRPRRIGRLEGVTIGSGQTATLADLPGAGTVLQLFLAVGSNGGHAPYDAQLFVTSDGASSPDWTADLGTLFATHHAQQLGGQWSCSSAHAELSADGKAAGYTLTLPMPFRAGMKVELANPTPDTVTLWTQVVYAVGDPEPMRLRGEGRPWSRRLGVGDDQPARLLTVPTGGGWLAALAFVGRGLSGVGDAALGWLERNLEVTTDQAAAPQFVGTGMEDLFCGSFYYHRRQGYGTPWSMIGAVDRDRRVAAQFVDLQALWGGLRFENGVRVDLGAQPGAPSHEQSWLTLYYQDVSA